MSDVGAPASIGGTEPLRSIRTLDGWLRTPIPLVRIQRFRALLGLYTALYLIVRFPVLWALGNRSAASLDPVGVWWWLSEPLPAPLVRAVAVVAVVGSCTIVIGRGVQWATPLAASSTLALATYRASFGQMLWFDNLMVLHLLLMGAWSVGCRRRTTGGTGTDTHQVDVMVSGFVLRLAGIVTVVTYLLAGVAKLRIGGWAWMDGDALARHVAFSAARLKLLGATPSPLAEWLLAVPGLLTAGAAATLLVELLAPVALLGRRWASCWAVAAWSMHVGIAASMFVVFAYPLTLVAFAPLFRLERLPTLRWPTQ
jgi:hypothetical protein